LELDDTQAPFSQTVTARVVAKFLPQTPCLETCADSGISNKHILQITMKCIQENTDGAAKKTRMDGIK